MLLRFARRFSVSMVIGYMLLVSLAHLTHAAAPPVYYEEPQEDLRVKVLGGFIVIQRTFANGQWYPNHNWAPLKLTFDTGAPLTGTILTPGTPVKAITRGKANYTRTAPGVFT